MVTTFCLRLALGMLAPMLLLPADIVPPRFFRVQFLSVLPLLVIAGIFIDHWVEGAFWILLLLAFVSSFWGGVVWNTDAAVAGRKVMVLGAAFVFFAMWFSRWPMKGPPESILLGDDVASALMLGGAISAMLMGHSYLIAPSMSLSPLNRLLALLAIALGVRIVLACVGLFFWTRLSPAGALDMETSLWLGARWLLGLIFPIGLTWMAWETARIRSTQSATGILYVVTILVFLGELLSMLLVAKTGFPI